MFINVFLQANNLFNQEIITSVIGVIATLVGTILGWFLNNLSNRGKLTIFTFLWKENFRRKTSFEKKDDELSEIKEIQSYSYNTKLGIYNSSANTKIMRNIEIVFNNGKKDIKTIKPLSNDIDYYIFSSPVYKEIEAINIPPKAIAELNLHGVLPEECEELQYTKNVKNIYMIYKDETNKTKRYLIKSVNYSNYFDNINSVNKTLIK